MSSDPSTPVLTDKNGWDGKLRVEKKAQVVNAEILSDSDHSDPDAPPVQQIQADQGSSIRAAIVQACTDYSQISWKIMKLIPMYNDPSLSTAIPNEDRKSISSTVASPPSPHCTWIDFSNSRYVYQDRSSPTDTLQKICLRQNQISHIEFPHPFGDSLQDLDLYDNLISHIRGLDHLVHLTSLDLSFNKIKHIKNLAHLKELKDLYFVQNRIQKIENLEALNQLRNLELAANRIRVCMFRP